MGLEANGRQTCRVCGRPDKFNFHVPDHIWQAAVPPPFVEGVVCLFCFDALAEMRRVQYAPHLTALCFAGDAAAFEFEKVAAVSL